MFSLDTNLRIVYNCVTMKIYIHVKIGALVKILATKHVGQYGIVLERTKNCSYHYDILIKDKIISCRYFDFEELTT